MKIVEKIARVLAPGLKGTDEVREIVKDEVRKARMALPITANYDPKNEGYRRFGGGGERRRDLDGMAQDRMFEVAYFMFDSSAMTKRMAKMDKTFLFGEAMTVTSGDKDVQKIIDRTWKDPINNMPLNFPEYMMWHGILGEQLWPVTVYPQNGLVQIGYEDPADIKDIYMIRDNRTQPAQVEMLGSGGRPGRKMSVIRQDLDPRSKSYGRLVGECFFFAINKPPNAARGRSDYLTLFDWIDGLERYGYNFLDRAEFMLNFVWDVLLKGMDESQIRDWLRDNPAPEPGSIRAHNEQVEWKAVSPDIKAQNFDKGFQMGKSFIMGAAGRPEAWFGGGGKAYQTEAEQFGQVPIKDLDERQLYHKYIAEKVIQFAIDQAVIAGRLSAEKAEAGFTVNMPEISKKDLAKMVNGVPQLATALSVAVDRGWVRSETAARTFISVLNQMGQEVDAEEEIQKSEVGGQKSEVGGQKSEVGGQRSEDRVTEDYRGMPNMPKIEKGKKG